MSLMFRSHNEKEKSWQSVSAKKNMEQKRWDDLFKTLLWSVSCDVSTFHALFDICVRVGYYRIRILYYSLPVSQQVFVNYVIARCKIWNNHIKSHWNNLYSIRYEYLNTIFQRNTVIMMLICCTMGLYEV